MGTKTAIAWTDTSWNPLRGCSRVSAGCEHCYAEAVAARFSGPGQPYEGLARTVNGHPQWTGVVRLLPENLEEPLHWRKPRRVFVNSMSDLFHPDVPWAFIDQVFAVMAACPHHQFQILTKRPERMREYVTQHAFASLPTVRCLEYELDYAPNEHARRVFDSNGATQAWPLPNVWLGTSVENQAIAPQRLDPLVFTPAAVHFVSAEPLLGPLDLRLWLHREGRQRFRAAGSYQYQPTESLQWVIVGGESGAGYRPMRMEWLERIVTDCREAGVPCFTKQQSARFPGQTDQILPLFFSQAYPQGEPAHERV